ncbi:MAG: BrnT family toxin [Acidobacteria bacterium]|nr:BrnT family toxin [Acidobacteriota bacterium]MBM4043300.1 BrnT family toxin [Planctomycetota bacterium]
MNDDIFARLAQCTGFDWDSGNAPKLWERHQVTPGECEQVFFGELLLVARDVRHSQAEQRWAAWGRTTEGRALAVVFTLRGELIRPLSARDMNRKERRLYEQAESEADS